MDNTLSTTLPTLAHEFDGQSNFYAAHVLNCAIDPILTGKLCQLLIAMSCQMKYSYDVKARSLSNQL